MTLDEYNKVLSELTDPDKVGNAILKLKDEIAIDFTKIDELSKKNEELSNKVSELRDTNNRLILKVTSPIEKQPEVEVEKTPDESLINLLTRIKGE